MRLLIQRVHNASATSIEKGTVAGKIQKGLLIFVGLTHTDSMETTKKLAQKIVKLRLWKSLVGDKHWDSNVMENKYELLVLSQSTLYSAIKEGNLDLAHDASHKDALPLYEQFIKDLRSIYDPTKICCCMYGENVHIDTKFDGPLTLILDSEKDK